MLGVNFNMGLYGGKEGRVLSRPFSPKLGQKTLLELVFNSLNLCWKDYSREGSKIGQKSEEQSQNCCSWGHGLSCSWGHTHAAMGTVGCWTTKREFSPNREINPKPWTDREQSVKYPQTVNTFSRKMWKKREKINRKTWNCISLNITSKTWMSSGPDCLDKNE